MPCATQRVLKPIKKETADKKKQKPKPKAQLKKIVQQKAKKLGWNLRPASNTAIGRWKLIATKPFTQDRIEIQMLGAGVLKITVPGTISAPNHMSAENFLREIHEAHGGEMEVRQIHSHGAHVHVHTHAHT